MRSLTKIVITLVLAIEIATATGGFSMGSELNYEWKRYVIKVVQPEYPRLLWDRGIHGSGVYRLIINQKTGLVDEVKVVKRPLYAILNEYAAKAFLQWKFQPVTVREAVIPLEWQVTGISRTVH